MEVLEREIWRIAVENLDYPEQHAWAALAGARVNTQGWRRARAMLQNDQTKELRRRFLLTCVQRNRNAQLRLKALGEIADLGDPDAFDDAIDIVGTWSREDKRAGTKTMLQALIDKRIGRRDQAQAWVWRLAGYTRELHEEYAVQRWPETKRLLGLLVNSSGRAHGRNARRLVHAARKQDRRLAVALLAAAVSHTPEGEEVLRGARMRMARKPAAVARELLRNFPKGGKRGASANAATATGGGDGLRRGGNGDAPRSMGTASDTAARSRSSDGPGGEVDFDEEARATVARPEDDADETPKRRNATATERESQRKRAKRRERRSRRQPTRTAKPKARRKARNRESGESERRQTESGAETQTQSESVERRRAGLRSRSGGHPRHRGRRGPRRRVGRVGSRARRPRRRPRSRSPRSPRALCSASRLRHSASTRRLVGARATLRARSLSDRRARSVAGLRRRRETARSRSSAGNSSGAIVRLRPMPRTAQPSWGRASIRMPGELAALEVDVVGPLDLAVDAGPELLGDLADGEGDGEREHRVAGLRAAGRSPSRGAPSPAARSRCVPAVPAPPSARRR